MGIPMEIRQVPRPPNTIVYAYGKNRNLYGVKQRVFVQAGDRVVQKDGPTVGHIVGLRYVPSDLRPKIRESASDILSWAPAKLVADRTRDLFEDLVEVFNYDDAVRTYVMAVLRTVDPGIKDDEFKDAYGESWIRMLYPNVRLSKDTVGRHLYDLGRTFSKIVEFSRNRASRVPGNHNIAVDGMLKSYESGSNPLSEMSRKALLKGSSDVSVMFAYDIEEMEPICSAVYPGNMPDVSAFGDFMKTNGISKGIIVTDKGFSYNEAKDHFMSNPGLHFLIPLKRNSKVIGEYRALSFDSSLDNRYAVQSRKVRMHDGRWLYAFRDLDIAKTEEAAWTNTRDTYDPADLEEARKGFGTIVFASDLDIPPEAAYAAYEERWEIEVMFRFYKSILELDETRVHSLQSVIGTEFVNLLSVIMTCRLRKAFYSVEKMRKKSYSKNMKVLRRGVMIRNADSGEWELVRMTESDRSKLVDLGVIEFEPAPPAPAKRGPGRPRKNPPKAVA